MAGGAIVSQWVPAINEVDGHVDLKSMGQDDPPDDRETNMDRLEKMELRLAGEIAALTTPPGIRVSAQYAQ